MFCKNLKPLKQTGDDRRLGLEPIEQVGKTCWCTHTHNLLWVLPSRLLPEGCVWAQTTIGAMSEPQVASQLFTQS